MTRTASPVSFNFRPLFLSLSLSFSRPPFPHPAFPSLTVAIHLLLLRTGGTCHLEPPPKCTTDADCAPKDNTAADTVTAREQFETFRAQHSRDYAPGEEAVRFAAFQDNMARAAALGGAPHYGITGMADRTRAEFNTMAGYNHASLTATSGSISDNRLEFDFSSAAAPTPIDWVAKGAVSGPVDQGVCGEYKRVS